MSHILFKAVVGFGLFALFTAPTLAEDRNILGSQVSVEARQLPMLNRLPPTNRLRLAIGLPWRNQTALTNLFHQIYNNGSTNFHHYLTPEQFTDQFGPTEQDYQTVINYAKSNRLEIVGTFGNRALVDVAGSVADIESMFQVHLGNYQHPMENRRFYAPDMPPSVVAGLPVLYVSGMNNYVIPHPHGHRTHLNKNQILTRNGRSVPEGGSALLGTNAVYAGTDFRNAYVPGTMLTGAGQVVGLFELDGYTPSDIQAYETIVNNVLKEGDFLNVPLQNVLLGVTNVAGINNDEVALDIEMAIAMAPGLRQINVYEGTNYEDIINEMAYPNQGEPRPNQISCSWGIDWDTNIMQGLIELGMQGQSFFIASGDNGAYQNGTNSDTEQDYLYMTAVGGTQLFMKDNGASWQAENVWDDPPPTNFQYFASTGGTLSEVPIPDYQEGISVALNQGSTQYRNIPDVAMVAKDILAVSTAVSTNGPPTPGESGNFVGTSAAAPLWASYTALVNQQAAALGKPPVGFLNPAIYAIAQGPSYSASFHDITGGNNAWNNTNAGTSSLNLYHASSGYDLCTGWGTPAGTNLINVLITYAAAVFVDFNYIGNTQNGNYNTPFKTLAGGTSAVHSGGTIIIKTAGSSAETPTISKPMTITAVGGAAKIGQ